MKTKKSKSRKGPDAPGHLSDTDLTALTTFCDSVQIEDLSFESWQDCLDHLDLTVPLFLSAAEAAQGGERPVSFARTTRAHPSDRPARATVTCLVQIPKGATNGQEIRVKGQGDVVAGRTGDLVVHLRLKS